MLQNCSIQSPLMSTVLDCRVGSMYAVSISDSALLQFLQNSKQDSERLAALHCALLYFRHTEDLEMQVRKEPPLSFFSNWCCIQSSVRAWMIPAKEEKSWLTCFGSARSLISWAAWIALLVKAVLKTFISVSLLHGKSYYWKQSFYSLLQHMLKQRDVTNSPVLILTDNLVDFWEPVNMSFFWPHSRIYHR